MNSIESRDRRAGDTISDRRRHGAGKNVAELLLLEEWNFLLSPRVEEKLIRGDFLTREVGGRREE